MNNNLQLNRQFIHVFLLLLMWCQSIGQTERESDKITLNNGYTLRGEIVEYKLNESILFKFESGYILEIPQNYLRKIYPNYRDVKIVQPNRFRNKGIYHALSGGVSLNKTGGYSLAYAAGYRLDKLLGLGIGAGLDNYDDGEGRRIIPVFGEVRGFLLDRKITPYYSLRIGHGFGLVNDEFGIIGTSGGIYVNPEIGYRLGGNETVNAFVGIGLKLQNSSFEYRQRWESTSIFEAYKYRRYMFNMGIVF